MQRGGRPEDLQIIASHVALEISLVRLVSSAGDDPASAQPMDGSDNFSYGSTIKMPPRSIHLERRRSLLWKTI
jgi:hypothetical protein